MFLFGKWLPFLLPQPLRYPGSQVQEGGKGEKERRPSGRGGVGGELGGEGEAGALQEAEKWGQSRVKASSNESEDPKLSYHC